MKNKFGTQVYHKLPPTGIEGQQVWVEDSLESLKYRGSLLQYRLYGELAPLLWYVRDGDTWKVRKV